MYFSVILLTALLRSATAGNCNCEDEVVYPNKTVKTSYDYIVVGSGSAGATLAVRLAQDPANYKVLLLEAGGPPPSINYIPLACFGIEGKPDSDWLQLSLPQKTSCQDSPDKTCFLSQFKGLGGCSSHNAMMCVRGSPADFDSWEKAGCTGWGYQKVLPYFKKSEGHEIPANINNGYHGTDGPMTVGPLKYKTPLADIIMEAAKENNEKINPDYNAASQIGCSPIQLSQRCGLRCGTEKGFLRPATTSCPNLDIITYCLVTKIVIDNDKVARSVIIEKDKMSQTVNANKEIIISAGAFQSPKLLMLSGVGPKAHLEEMGIKVVADSPVGESLIDHPHISGLIYKLNDSVSLVRERVINDEAAAQLLRGKGPYTSPNGIETVYFMATKYQDNKEWADMMIVPVAQQFLLSKPAFLPYDCMSMVPILVKPESRGTVRLASTDPHVNPLVDLNLNTHEKDRLRFIEGIKKVRDFMRTKTMLKYNPTLLYKTPGCEKLEPMSDEYINCTATYGALTTLHFAGTCKMGDPTDPTTVVDPELRVKGIKNLRVADASIMPNVVSANTHTSSVMIGEKAADMILNPPK